MQRRLDSLFLRLQGAEVPVAADDSAGGKGVPQGNLLVDITVAAVSLLVVVGFVGRFGRGIVRMPRR
jgi:hypothetical protein